jgi:hypothetical protein
MLLSGRAVGGASLAPGKGPRLTQALIWCRARRRGDAETSKSHLVIWRVLSDKRKPNLASNGLYRGRDFERFGSRRHALATSVKVLVILQNLPEFGVFLAAESTKSMPMVIRMLIWYGRARLAILIPLGGHVVGQPTIGSL